MCHIVAASHRADAVGVAELLTKTNCPLDAVDVDVIALSIIITLLFILINF